MSQSTISLLGSVPFGRNRSDMNIQQQTKLEVTNTDTAMADNEELDPQTLQDISNVFTVADLLSN